MKIDDLVPGEVFITACDDNLWMRIYRGEYNAVRLHDGYLVKFTQEDKLLPVKRRKNEN
jgi:hypothetical protein